MSLESHVRCTSHGGCAGGERGTPGAAGSGHLLPGPTLTIRALALCASGIFSVSVPNPRRPSERRTCFPALLPACQKLGGASSAPGDTACPQPLREEGRGPAGQEGRPTCGPAYLLQAQHPRQDPRPGRGEGTLRARGFPPFAVPFSSSPLRRGPVCLLLGALWPRNQGQERPAGLPTPAPRVGLRKLAGEVAARLTVALWHSGGTWLLGKA